MKCPKCGFDNPEDVLFCKECDWRTDIPYVPERKPNAAMFCALALVIGIAAAALCIKDDTAIAAVVLGAAGMVLGGYAVNLPRLLGGDRKTLLTLIAGVGLMLSMVGFMLGLYEAVL
ncbi:MAG: zinc ribbon domain-containing protein [Candidatus Methanomethylophilaceae archaeon]|nr:zinc ribbon domain-containing protein [Candidatus Methanomethylophilaceae archaeon]MBR7005983.1 zinc ribbon domain-containing protein [Candidatus Methanomethylophilaceae archaeon]